MGHKERLKTSLEEDVVYARDIYCFPKNNPSLIKFVKRAIAKRSRAKGKKIVAQELHDKE
jgi:hypothetical protein